MTDEHRPPLRLSSEALPSAAAIRFARLVLEDVTDLPPLILIANALTVEPWNLPYGMAARLTSEALRNLETPTHERTPDDD